MSDRHGGRATMREVAALAGVSLKTVSRVVNGEGTVSAELTARVRRAVAQLDFEPNLAASGLRRADGRTGQIAVLVEDLSNPFFATLLRAVGDVAREHQALVFAASVDEDADREAELVRAFGRRRADGIIVAPCGPRQEYLLPQLHRGTPFVFVDRPPRGGACDAVLSDNRGGAASAVRHLAAHGHRRIAYLGDLATLPTARERLAGYRDQMAREGLGVRAGHVLEDLHSVDAAALAAFDLMGTPDPPTALFASQNNVAMGAMSALRHLGLQHRVALVGLDDFPLADLLDPPLTVVAQPVTEIGRTAAARLFARIAGDASAPEELRIATRLIERGSGEIPAP